MCRLLFVACTRENDVFFVSINGIFIYLFIFFFKYFFFSSRNLETVVEKKKCAVRSRDRYDFPIEFHSN